MGSDRRRSIDSSDSSDSSDSGHEYDKKHKDKKDKKYKDKKDKKDKHGDSSFSGQSFPDPARMPHGRGAMPLMPNFHNDSPQQAQRFMPEPDHNFGAHTSPRPAANNAPPSGWRIPLSSQSQFPNQQQLGPPPCTDADGSPVYIGSALLDKSVHPCKIVPHHKPPAYISYGGAEVPHDGRFDLLPFDPETMEFVKTSGGWIPQGRRPIEGGYEEHGGKLYHAVANVNGVRVPGKAGEHLGGCNVPFGGGEHAIANDYELLVWKY